MCYAAGGGRGRGGGAGHMGSRDYSSACSNQPATSFPCSALPMPYFHVDCSSIETEMWRQTAAHLADGPLGRDGLDVIPQQHIAVKHGTQHMTKRAAAKLWVAGSGAEGISQAWPVKAVWKEGGESGAWQPCLSSVSKLAISLTDDAAAAAAAAAF